MKNKKRMGYFQLSMGMILAGSSVVTGKILQSYPIFLVVDLSLIFAVIFIFPIARMIEGKIKIKEIRKSDWKYIVLQSLMGIVFFRLFMMLGLKYTSAVKAGIVLSATPAVLALLATLLLKERLTKKMVVGIAVCVTGILMINLSKGEISSFNTEELIGMCFIMLSVVSESLFTIFRKKQGKGEKPLTSTFWVMLIAFVLLLPLGINDYLSLENNIFKANFIFPVIYYGVFASSLAYVCWFSGLAKVNANEASGFTGFMPVASLILAALVLGESIKTVHIIGMACILLGINLITRKTINTMQDKKGDETRLSERQKLM